MGKLEEIRERLEVCDKQIVSVLEDRMDIIKEIMEYKGERTPDSAAGTGKAAAQNAERACKRKYIQRRDS